MEAYPPSRELTHINRFKRSRTKPRGWTGDEVFERGLLTAIEHNNPLDPEKGRYQEVGLSVDCSISSTLFSEVFVLIVEISPYFEMMLFVTAYRINNDHCVSAEKNSEQPNSIVAVNNHY